MFEILYGFFTLHLFIPEYECYYVFKGGDNNMQMVPQEFNMIYKQFANPLKRLAEMMPDHNVEVQLEMVGNNNVPIRTTKLNLMHFRNLPYKNVKLREIDVGREEDARLAQQHIPTTTVVPPTKPAAAPMSPPLPPPPQIQYVPQQMQPYYTFPPGFNQINPAFNRLNRYRFNPAMYMRNDGENQEKPPDNSPGPDIANNGGGPAPPKTEPTTTETLHEKKPVYMTDLKKALDDFEKRFFAKQKESKFLFSSDGTDRANDVEEAKKPLLKKDLWMAMGLKYMTGCPHAHAVNSQNHATSPSSIVPVGTTRRIIKFVGPDSAPLDSESMNPKVQRIMQLLKAGMTGVKVDRGQKPDESNLQWLQVKIPKTLDNK